MGKHPSHVTRISMGASTYDEICVNCGAHDLVPGGWGELEKPCPSVTQSKNSESNQPSKDFTE